MFSAGQIRDRIRLLGMNAGAEVSGVRRVLNPETEAVLFPRGGTADLTHSGLFDPPATEADGFLFPRTASLPAPLPNLVLFQGGALETSADICEELPLDQLISLPPVNQSVEVAPRDEEDDPVRDAVRKGALMLMSPVLVGALSHTASVNLMIAGIGVMCSLSVGISLLVFHRSAKSANAQAMRLAQELLSTGRPFTYADVREIFTFLIHKTLGSHLLAAHAYLQAGANYDRPLNRNEPTADDIAKMRECYLSAYQHLNATGNDSDWQVELMREYVKELSRQPNLFAQLARQHTGVEGAEAFAAFLKKQTGWDCVAEIGPLGHLWEYLRYTPGPVREMGFFRVPELARVAAPAAPASAAPSASASQSAEPSAPPSASTPASQAPNYQGRKRFTSLELDD